MNNLKWWAQIESTYRNYFTARLKKALPDYQEAKKENSPRKENRKPMEFNSKTAKQPSEPTSFEEMMNKFKQASDEKFSELKRKNPDVHSGSSHL